MNTEEFIEVLTEVIDDRLDKFTIDDISKFYPGKCVIHLIEIPDEEYQSSNVYDEEDCIKFISKWIDDNCPELWKMMKRGDLLENVSESSYRCNGRYIINTNDKGPVVRNLCTDFYDYGSPLVEFYSITEFPLRYFDDENLEVNNKFVSNNECNQTFHSYWHGYSASTSLDWVKLGIDIKDVKSCGDYEYVSTIYDSVKYVIITGYEFEDILISEMFSVETPTDEIIKLLEKESVEECNIIYLDF